MDSGAGKDVFDQVRAVRSSIGAPQFASPPPITFDAWTALRGLAGAEAAATADPDRDGRTNLEEFAFDLDPQRPGTPAPAVMVELAEEARYYSFVRDTTRAGLEFRLQVSPDLLEWKSVAAALPGADAGGTGGGVVVEEKNLGAGRFKVTVRPPSHWLALPARYARLQILSAD